MEKRKLMYLDGEARDRMIRFLRRRMDDFNISLSDLRKSIETDASATQGPDDMHPIFDDNVAVYQDLFGNRWDGQGEPPMWVKRAADLGIKLDHFRVKH